MHTKPYCLKYLDVPEPQTGDDDVMIRVKACGICGSDVQGYTGRTGRRIPPVIMGDEAAGIVEKAGRNAGQFKGGDRVCFDSTVYCNRCLPCRSGFYNRCVSRQVLGVSTPHFKRDGAFAEYVSVPWWIVSEIPENMSFAEAAMLEPVSIAMHAVNRTVILDDDTVLVIGAGTIGLFLIQAAKLKNAGRVIAADINEFRLKMAKRLGADELVNPAKTGLVDTVLGLTGKKGVDAAIEAVGFAETFRSAAAATKTGGFVTAVGNLEKMVEFDLQDFISRELTFCGSYASAGEFRDCIGLVASGKINVGPLISGRLPLKEGGRAFERLLEGKENLLKIILEP